MSKRKKPDLEPAPAPKRGKLKLRWPVVEHARQKPIEIEDGESHHEMNDANPFEARHE